VNRGFQRETIMSSESYKQGRKDGQKFVDQARKHPVATRLDPGFNNKPSSRGDSERRAGITQGIKDKKGDRFW
jgi:hypothetical protein